MAGESYARNKKFKRSGAALSINFRTEENGSLDDYSSILREINSIFNQCSRAVTSAQRVGNANKIDGLLVVSDVRHGSVEFLCDAYFAGTVSGIIANTVCNLFIYVMRRINGKRTKDARLPLDNIDQTAITGAKLAEAISRAVATTTNDRASLKAKVNSLTMTITVGFDQKSYEVTEPD